MMTTTTKTLIAGITIVATALILIAVLGSRSAPVVSQPEGVACTMDAKMCPDGSYVGRTGPKCEFAACPGAATDTPALEDLKETTINAKFGETVSLLGASAKVTEVVEDSRCPATANCIWAGTVRIKARATYGIFSKTVTLTLGEPYVLNGHSATLTAVTPVKTMSEIPNSDYTFTFLVK